MIRIMNEDILDEFQERLLECLSESVRTGKLIDTTGLRQIGKTTTLINFAIVFGLPVIEPSREMARRMIELSGYEHIYSSTEDLRGRNFKRVLIDEGVNRERLEQMGFEVLGGYQSY